MLEQNRADDAQRYAERAVEIAREKGVPYELIDSLNTWCAVCSFSGLEARAMELADEAVERARAFGNAYQLYFSVLMASIARSRTDPASAISLLQSTEVHRYDSNRSGLATMFRGIAHMHLGERREAAQDVGESLGHFQVDPNEYFLRMVTFVAAGILSACGIVTPAVRLLSACVHLRQSAHLVGTPYQLDAQQRMRARLEQSLDPDTFASEWTAGQHLSLADAVTLARDQLATICEGEDHA